MASSSLSGTSLLIRVGTSRPGIAATTSSLTRPTDLWGRENQGHIFFYYTSHDLLTVKSNVISGGNYCNCLMAISPCDAVLLRTTSMIRVERCIVNIFVLSKKNIK